MPRIPLLFNECRQLYTLAWSISFSGYHDKNSSKRIFSSWIACFGVPVSLVTDQGTQFKTTVRNNVTKLLGVQRIRRYSITTAFHPQSNGMVERFYRQLKSAIKCYESTNWVGIIPSVLLGMCCILKDISAHQLSWCMDALSDYLVNLFQLTMFMKTNNICSKAPLEVKQFKTCPYIIRWQKEYFCFQRFKGLNICFSPKGLC